MQLDHGATLTFFTAPGSKLTPGVLIGKKQTNKQKTEGHEKKFTSLSEKDRQCHCLCFFPSCVIRMHRKQVIVDTCTSVKDSFVATIVESGGSLKIS